MKILLTGATGFLGGWIAREAVAAGHGVRALIRASSRRDNLEGLALEYAEGDVLDRASVERAVAGCDAVVHAAGWPRITVDDPRKLYDLNVRAVEIVLEAALAAGVKRALQISSVAALGGAHDRTLADESTASNAEALRIDYLVSKHRGEQAALAVHARGLPVVVLRPGFVTGPGDLLGSSAATLLAIVKGKLPVFVRGGASFCDARDVAKAHVAALERGRPGEVYLLGGHNLEMADMVRRLCDVAGVRPPREVPFPLAFAAGAASDAIRRVTGRRLNTSLDLVRSSHLYTWVSSAKAERELAYSIRPFEDSVRDMLRFFIAQGRLEPSTPELQALA